MGGGTVPTSSRLVGLAWSTGADAVMRAASRWSVALLHFPPSFSPCIAVMEQ
jgi:hypothetical protein